MMYSREFKWFIGVVEDRNDPLMVGRVRVRTFGMHNESKSEIPTELLHWAQVIMPTTSASTSGIGDTNRLVEGSFVVGFFLDGKSFQDPIILGSIQGIPESLSDSSIGFNDPREILDASSVPGLLSNAEYAADGTGPILEETDPRPSYPRVADEPDTNRLSRNEKYAETNTKRIKDAQNAGYGTVVNTGISNEFTEPADPYAASYPYNKVIETESGHVIEYDDTPTAERIHVMHRTGTRSEIYPSGDLVEKTVGDKYETVGKNDNQHIEGDRKVRVDKSLSVMINGDNLGGDQLEVQIGSGGNININVMQGNVKLTVNGNIEETITGDVTRTIGGSLTESIKGDRTISSGGTTLQESSLNHMIKGKQVHMN